MGVQEAKMLQDVLREVLLANDLPGGAPTGNIVTVIDRLAYSTDKVAAAITPVAVAGTDAVGGSVSSLTEAVMGVTGGLCQIAEAIQELARREARQAIADHDDDEFIGHDIDRHIADNFGTYDVPHLLVVLTDISKTIDAEDAPRAVKLVAAILNGTYELGM